MSYIVRYYDLMVPAGESRAKMLRHDGCQCDINNLKNTSATPEGSTNTTRYATNGYTLHMAICLWDV